MMGTKLPTLVFGGLLIVSQIAVGLSEFCASPVCEYWFDVEWRPSLVYIDNITTGNTYNVKMVGNNMKLATSTFHDSVPHSSPLSDSEAATVNTLDGFQRDIITINGQHPGPTIDVIQGAQVVIHVTNLLFQDGLTIHMHGIHQRYNMWNDGVPFLTQCPTIADTSFTYRFIADPPGTHWYHSHLAQQRMDGLQGMLIVRPSGTVNNDNTFAIAAQDYIFPNAESHMADNPDTVFWARGPGNYFLAPDLQRTSAAGNLDSLFPFDSILINGKGRRPPYTSKWPLEKFVVKPGETYRFHVAHTGQEAAMRVSLDDHLLLVVGTDDGDLDPIEVESFIIFSGETIDFIVTAKTTNTRHNGYWMRFSTIGVKNDIWAKVKPYEGRAIVQYSDSVNDIDPSSTPTSCTSSAHCLVFNCPWERYPDNVYRDCKHMADARSLNPVDVTEFGLDQAPDKQIFLNFNDLFEHNINGRAFVTPKAPVSQLSQAGLVHCDPVECEDGCACTYIIDVGYNDVIELVFTDYELDFNGVISTHPVHLHGNSFAVLKQGFAPINNATGRVTGPNPDVECITSSCINTTWVGNTPTLNLQNPPIKNTLVIPPFGYAVVRFRALNPGYWIMHCHVLRHSEEGMAMVLHVGNDLPDIPADFPKCEPDFDFDSSFDFDDYLQNQKTKDYN